jgi:hypothetical protein
VIAPATSFSLLAAAVESLMYTADADTFTLVWTRRQGTDPDPLPLVFDCFRAGPAQIQWGGVDQVLGNAIAVVTLTFSALPYGRSDVATVVDFQNNLSTSAAPLPAVQLEVFSDPPDNWTPSTAAPSGYSGASAWWDPFQESAYFAAFSSQAGATVSPYITFTTAASGAASAGNSYRHWLWIMSPQGWSGGGVYAAIQWYDGSGNFISQSFSPTVNLPAGVPVLCDTGLVTAPALTTHAVLVAAVAAGSPPASTVFLVAGGPWGLGLGTVLTDGPASGLQSSGGNTNYLSLAQSGSVHNSDFETTVGTWNNAALLNCTVTDTALQAHSGSNSMLMTSAAAGNMAADNTTTPVTNGMPVVPGGFVTIQGWFRAAASPRSCNVGCDFYTAAGGFLGTVFGPNITDSTSAWTQAFDGGLIKAPATAAFARATVRVQSTGAASEIHYVDDVTMTATPLITQLGPLQPTPAGTTPSLGYWQVAFRSDGVTAFGGVNTNNMAVTPGKQVVADLWLMSPQGYSSAMQISVNWYTSGSSYISTSTQTTATLPAGTPVHFRGTFSAPSNAAFANLFVKQNTPAAAVTTIFYVAGGVAVGTPVMGTTGALTNAPLPGSPAWQSSASSAIPSVLLYQTPWANARYFGAGINLLSGQPFNGIGYLSVCNDLDISGMQALTLWAAFGSSNYYTSWCKKGGLVTFHFTLTDAQGNTLQFSRVQKCLGSNNSNSPRWNKVRARLPSSATFNYSDVVSFAVYVANHYADLRFTRVYLSDLQAVPPPLPNPNQPNFGIVYDLGHVEGSARAPMSLQVQLPGTASYTQKFATPGTYGWVAPPAATTVTAYLVAGGGHGSRGPAGPPYNGLGAGGGGGTAATTSAAITPGNSYTLIVGHGGNGTAPYDATDSTVTFDAVSVTAHHGLSPANNSTSGAAGGAAGTGGFAGGSGGSGIASFIFGGGGGSSGGSAGGGNNGGNATSSAIGAGGAAVTGGGKGGSGADGFPALVGASPGGGGGGSVTTVAPWLRGGNGGDGLVQLTYTSVALMQTLVAHRPSFYAPPEFTPFVPVPPGDGSAGTIEYPVPSLVAGVAARFGSPHTGTFSVVAVPYAWSGGGTSSSARTITVTVKQYEQSGGQSYSASVAASVVPLNLAQLTVPHAATGFAVIGEITLPPNLMPPDNTDTYFTVSIASTTTADQFQDILFLDTMGSTVIVQSPVSYQSLYIDEPDINADLGNVLGTLFDRADAVSILDRAIVSGPPLDVDPYGNRSLLVYSMEGPANAQVSYFPRHWAERPL